MQLVEGSSIVPVLFCPNAEAWRYLASEYLPVYRRHVARHGTYAVVTLQREPRDGKAWMDRYIVICAYIYIHIYIYRYIDTYM
jgi:hypothetical protein